MHGGGTRRLVGSIRTLRELQRQAPELRAASPGGLAQLSFGQEWIWLLHHVSPGNPVFNTYRAYRISGRLCMPALAQSLNVVVQRHGILRTSFPTGGNDRAVPMVRDRVTITPTLVNLEWIDTPGKEIECGRICADVLRKPFRLEEGPLLRSVVVRLEDARYAALVVSHQIVMDGWSWGVFMRELMEAYRAFSAYGPFEADEVPVQYVDFASWQRAWVRGTAKDRLLAFWKGELRGTIPDVDIPTDHPRSEARSFRSASESLVLTKELGESLKSLSDEEGVTLFVTLLSAFTVLLHRYTLQEDIVVVSPTAGRHRPEVRDAIGPFSNNLILRARFSGNPSFRRLLGRVQDAFLGAFAHQDLPFDMKVEALEQGCDRTDDSPLNVLFIFENAPAPQMETAGLSLNPFNVDKGSEKFDLYVSLEDTDQGLIGTWTYRTDLFEALTIKRMIRQFETLLKAVRADPGRAVLDLPCFTEAELENLLASRAAGEGEPCAAPADAIPHRTDAGIASRTGMMDPRAELQATVAAVWRDLLRRDVIDINDGFFEQGGNSLLLIRAAARLRELLSRDISLIEMFRHPTVRTLAEYLSREQSAPSSYRSIRERAEKARRFRRWKTDNRGKRTETWNIQE